MTREIKFRAWDSKNDVMRDWDYIRTSWTLGILNGDSHTEIMQYTSLKDKNGKEIYEGDLLGWETEKRGRQRGIVVWSMGCLGWSLDLVSSKGNATSIPRTPEEREIDGNIYENSDLLK
jgi:hypothetical protein